jgi:hypothetical protein
MTSTAGARADVATPATTILVSSSARLHGTLPSTVQPFFARTILRPFILPAMQPPPDDGRSGRILVISMVGAAVLLGLFALRYRQAIPTITPAAPVAPTTGSAPSTAPASQ